MTEADRALANPAAVFRTPCDVVLHPTLSRKQKIEVLRRWESDIRSLQAPCQESDEWEDLLSEILESLHELDYWPDLDTVVHNGTARNAGKTIDRHG